MTPFIVMPKSTLLSKGVATSDALKLKVVLPEAIPVTTSP